MKCLNILLTVGAMIVMILALVVGVHRIKLEATNPCHLARENVVCESESSLVGFGTHEELIPISPVCGCMSRGVQIYYPIE